MKRLLLVPLALVVLAVPVASSSEFDLAGLNQQVQDQQAKIEHQQAELDQHQATLDNLQPTVVNHETRITTLETPPATSSATTPSNNAAATPEPTDPYAGMTLCTKQDKLGSSSYYVPQGQPCNSPGISN